MERGKRHYEVPDEPGLPTYEKQRRRREGVALALCGYTRRLTTFNKEEVTCYWCKRRGK